MTLTILLNHSGLRPACLAYSSTVRVVWRVVVVVVFALFFSPEMSTSCTVTHIY